MRILFLAVAVVLIPLIVLGTESLPWAYPQSPQGLVRSSPDPGLRHVPGSGQAYTQAQIEDPFSAVDWFPAEHPPMPSIVQYGDRPTVLGCALCHLANGLGHPESASLAGLPATYLEQQIAAYRDGSRIGGYSNMQRISKGLTDSETQQAAAWFSTLPTHPWVRVVETKDVPKTYVGEGNMRVVSPGTETEPLADRIIEVPQNLELTKDRDPHSGTIAYVPLGSIARGKVLVTAGAGDTMACGTCHGASLKGIADVPSISGRSPIYIFRQLNDIQSGARSGPNVALMQGVVAHLTTEDMIAISAYLASLQP